MTCLHFQKVKSCNAFGVKFAYVPCGYCEECRRDSQLAWKFRLLSEFTSLADKGWNVCFCTLTYNNKNLPHIPRALFVDTRSGFTSIPCFNRHHITDTILKLRKFFWKHFNIKSIRYFVACEYGEHTQRPHYHAMFALPPTYRVFVPRLGKGVTYRFSPYIFYKKLEEIWTTNYGFIIPRYYEGGTDSEGNKHKPFLVDNVGDSSAYCAKYVCKDLAFEQTINRDNLLESAFKEWHAKKDGTKEKICYRLKDYLCFHVQSRSLGLECLKTVDNVTKLSWIMKGRPFVGSDKLLPCPLYIKNKILFSPLYVYKKMVKTDSFGHFYVEFKRLVRRKVTSFFLQNYKEIYQKKVNYYAELFEKVTQKDFLSARGYSEENAEKTAFFWQTCIKRSRFSYEDFAHLYTAYFGVSRDNARLAPLPDVFLCRYLSPLDFHKIPTLSPQTLRKGDYETIQILGHIVCDILSHFVLLQDTEQEKLINKISDFFKSKE